MATVHAATLVQQGVFKDVAEVLPYVSERFPWLHDVVFTFQSAHAHEEDAD